MWARLQQLFTHRLDKVVGIDIGTGSVKVAAIKRHNAQLQLAAAGITGLPPGTIENGYCRDTEALSWALRQATNANGIRQREAVLSVGAPGLFIREVVYPLMSPDELAEAVKWDSEKHVAFAPDTYYLDYAIIGQGASELEMKVLLAASPREIIDDMVTAVKDAGLLPVAIDAEPLALYRTLAAAENAILVDIGAELSKVTLFQGGSPVVTRPIPIGGKQFTEVIMEVFELGYSEAELFKQRQKGLLQRSGQEGERTVIQQRLDFLATDLAREAARTAQYYIMQNKNTVVDKVFLTGGGARLENLPPYFAAQFDVPILIHDPLAGVTANSRLEPQYIRGLSLQLGVAAGLALCGGAA